MEAAVRGLGDALAGLTTPLPVKPVGVGGYWMATDRCVSYLGLEVLRYRVFRVEKIEQGKATLTAELRQYATSDEADLGSMAPGQKLGIERFESSGKEKLEWAAGGFLPIHGETSVRMQMLARVSAAGQGGNPQKAVVQTELHANLSAAPGKGERQK